MPKFFLPLSLLLALALAGGATAASAGSEPLPRAQQKTYGKTAVQATNVARTRNSLRTLRTNQCLHRFATRQANSMARKDSMYHQNLRPLLEQCHLRLAGENVAYGFTGGADTVNGWMHSPGHRANILNSGYRFVAVAATQSASGRWYAAQVFGASRR